LKEAFRLGLIQDGEAWMLMIQDRNLTIHTDNRSTADAIAGHIGSIPRIPEGSQRRLQQLFDTQARLEAVWLFGSRAMGRHREGSDIGLCLEGRELSHQDRLRLMAAIDELLLPWQVDVALRKEMPPELGAPVGRVGRCLWKRL